MRCDLYKLTVKDVLPCLAARPNIMQISPSADTHLLRLSSEEQSDEGSPGYRTGEILRCAQNDMDSVRWACRDRLPGNPQNDIAGAAQKLCIW